MASLIWSGALPGWETCLYDSAQGYTRDIRKTASCDEDENDSLTFSESELHLNFRKGVPLQPLSEIGWTTRAGHYPEYEWVKEVDPDDGSVSWSEVKTPTFRPSIAIQLIRAQRTKFVSGSFSTKVHIRTTWTDEKTENKEIVDDPCKVLEETREAQDSMLERGNTLHLVKQENEYQDEKRRLQEFEEWEQDLESV